MRLILILSALLAFQSGAASEFDDNKALADIGYSKAQYNLGLIYYIGKDVPANFYEAIKWFKKAAAQGHAMAQYNLGFMYANGEGVPENSIRAYLWWSMAKTQGRADAATNLDILKPKMTPQQLAEGQALAAKCYESDYKECD